KVDEVESYFGMRKISLARDDKGRLRIQLNNTNYFQFGPLDQGFWPDGLYTAPTDEALRYDIEVLKKLGFNMARKHVKVEPDRWYYWADKLGLLVWQDMPSGDQSAVRHRRGRARTGILVVIDNVARRKMIAAARAIDEPRGIKLLDEVQNANRVELSPAFVERHPR